jgi:hypothetical protein
MLREIGSSKGTTFLITVRGSTPLQLADRPYALCQEFGFCVNTFTGRNYRQMGPKNFLQAWRFEINIFKMQYDGMSTH